jgi:hypothetical protein
LPRPSSASGAKASTIRPYYLNGIGSRYAVFKDQAPASRRSKVGIFFAGQGTTVSH